MAHAQKTRFRLSAKRTSPFKSAGALVQSTAGSRGARISGSNAGYTMFRGSVKVTGYQVHSPVSPSLPFQCVTVCHHVSTGLYRVTILATFYLLSCSLTVAFVPYKHGTSTCNLMTVFPLCSRHQHISIRIF